MFHEFFYQMKDKINLNLRLKMILTFYEIGPWIKFKWNFQKHVLFAYSTWNSPQYELPRAECMNHTFAEEHFTVADLVYVSKHLKKSNAACFCTPIVLKLLIIVQMW